MIIKININTGAITGMRENNQINTLSIAEMMTKDNIELMKMIPSEEIMMIKKIGEKPIKIKNNMRKRNPISNTMSAKMIENNIEEEN